MIGGVILIVILIANPNGIASVVFKQDTARWPPARAPPHPSA